MHRHPALVPLSHDHHKALFIALRLRQAQPGTAADVRDATVAFWRTAGAAHFAAEEEVLLPALGDEHPVCSQVRAEHAAIRARIGALADAEPTPPLEDMHQLGRELSDHVRMEERELFPLLERTFDDETLQRLATATQSAERDAAT